MLPESWSLPGPAGPSSALQRLFVPTGVGRILRWLYIGAVALLALAVAIAVHLDIPVSHLTVDPVTVTGGQPYHGMLSNVGVLLMCAAAAICFFSAAVSTTNGTASPIRNFMLAGGLITSLLTLDDLFMLHEVVYPAYLHIGEKKVVLAYALLMAWYLARFRHIILRSSFGLLLLSFGFLAASLLFDMFVYILPRWHTLIEDGAKLLGYVSWLGYQLSVCHRALTGAGVVPATPRGHNTSLPLEPGAVVTPVAAYGARPGIRIDSATS